MIDLLKLNYNKKTITKTEGAENTLFLLDHETKIGFGRDDIGMYCSLWQWQWQIANNSIT